MKRLLASLALLSACASTPPAPTPELLQSLSLVQEPFGFPGVCEMVGRHGLGPMYREELTRRGLSDRDLDLISRQEVGTGMTVNGLTCMIGKPLALRRAFYPGRGHQWQFSAQDGSYYYFEGDGTAAGMRVTAWN